MWVSAFLEPHKVVLLRFCGERLVCESILCKRWQKWITGKMKWKRGHTKYIPQFFLMKFNRHKVSLSNITLLKEFPNTPFLTYLIADLFWKKSLWTTLTLNSTAIKHLIVAFCVHLWISRTCNITGDNWLNEWMIKLI